MLKQTVQLFIKALVIGVLINLGLQQMAARPLPADENTLQQYDQQSPLQQPAVDNTGVGLLNQMGE
jgi:hypothetical protein